MGEEWHNGKQHKTKDDAGQVYLCAGLELVHSPLTCLVLALVAPLSGSGLP